MEPTDQNMRAWDEVHRRRSQALRGELRLPDVVRRALADLNGKRVLHLQCATGEETAELAALGATVTGVDISAEALDVAREREPHVLWVQGDAQRLPAELRRGRFDLVYVSEGSLVWLQDLDAWAAGIVDALRRGGDLLLYEEHPLAQTMDAFGRAESDYFDETVQVSRGWTHFDTSEGPEPTQEKHERFWRLGQIVSAVARAGLVVRALEEYPASTSWRRIDRRLPGTFLLHARKAG
jgi:SAM-dependent methyltransferase